MIIGKPGINSLKDLKGQKVGLEVTLVEHLLLLKALEVNGMKQIGRGTGEHRRPTRRRRRSPAARWPRSARGIRSPARRLKQVAGSKPLFTSADAPRV